MCDRDAKKKRAKKKKKKKEERKVLCENGGGRAVQEHDNKEHYEGQLQILRHPTYSFSPPPGTINKINHIYFSSFFPQ
jgi:hypothetical protein